MFDSRKPTNDDCIDGTPVTITPEGDDWNLNSSQFKQNQDSYIDVYGQMILKERVGEFFINDNDCMRYEWNYKCGPLVDIESIMTMYSDDIFTSPSIMYKKEAEYDSAMAENGLLTNNINKTKGIIR